MPDVLLALLHQHMSLSHLLYHVLFSYFYPPCCAVFILLPSLIICRETLRGMTNSLALRWTSCRFSLLGPHTGRGQSMTLFASKSWRCSLALPPDQPRFHPRYRSPSTHPSRTEIQNHIPDRSTHLPPARHSSLQRFLFSASSLFPCMALSNGIHHTQTGLKVAMTSRAMNK